MKLHDLQVGQRFLFVDKHRGKEFEVTTKIAGWIAFVDVATGRIRNTWSNRLTYSMEVKILDGGRTLTLTQHEADMLTIILEDYYRIRCEEGATEELKSEINKLYLKIKI